MSQASLIRLADIVKDVKPGFACGREDPAGILQIRMNNVTREGDLDLTHRRLVPADLRAVKGSLVQPGDILFNATNSPDLVGKTALFVGVNEATVYSNHFLRIRPNTDLLMPAYLARWLQYQFSRGVFRSMCRQWVNQASVARDSLLQLCMPLPALDEQRQVVGVLERVSILRKKRRSAVSLIGNLERSVFLGMFGEPVDAWPRLTVEDLVDSTKGSIRTGPFGSQLLHGEFVDGGVAVLGIDNAVHNEFRWAGRRFITDEKYRKLSRYSVRPGDVLITIMGTCGRCAIVPDDIPTAINTKHLCCITLDRSKCLPEYLHSYFLWHPSARSYLQRSTKGAIMAGLNMSIIKSLPISVPPLSVQSEYVAGLRAVQDVKKVHTVHAESLDALFESLQHRAFGGELRLSKAQ